MDTKYNDETQNRPFGARFTDGDILKIDLRAYTQQLKAEEGEKNRDRNAITVFKSANVTITLIYLLSGAQVAPGNFEGTGIMSLQVISGRLEFINGENAMTVAEGEMVTVHEHIPFTANAMADTVCLLTMVKQ